MIQGPRRAIAPARLTTAVAITAEAARTTHGPRRFIVPTPRTTAVAAIAEAARMTPDQRRAIAPARPITVAGVLTAVAAVAATAEVARMRRDQRRAITPARHTTAGDTGRVLPLAALVLTTVAAAIKAEAARIRAGAVVAQSQKTWTADLTLSALRRHQLDHGLAEFPFPGRTYPQRRCTSTSRTLPLL